MRMARGKIFRAAPGERRIWVFLPLTDGRTTSLRLGGALWFRRLVWVNLPGTFTGLAAAWAALGALFSTYIYKRQLHIQQTLHFRLT